MLIELHIVGVHIRMINLRIVESAYGGTQQLPECFRHWRFKQAISKRTNARNPDGQQIRSLEHCVATVDSRCRSRYVESSLHQFVKKPPLGEAPCFILAGPKIGVLDQATDQSSPDILSQHEFAKIVSNDERIAAACGTQGPANRGHCLPASGAKQIFRDTLEDTRIEYNGSVFGFCNGFCQSASSLCSIDMLSGIAFAPVLTD